MDLYQRFEQYLPEMKELREEYNRHLKEKGISKTNEWKLYDYLCLIAASYSFDKEANDYTFSKPDMDTFLESDNLEKSRDLMYKVRSPLCHRMRTREMEDRIERFSGLVWNELRETPEGGDRIIDGGWYVKTFPAGFTRQMRDKDKVRYALNVKPGLGLFRKLDELCLKHQAFRYKVIDEDDYNQRMDPVIIYADKETHEEMLKKLSSLIGPYRRKDNYEMVGYQNLGNGIFTADEVKGKDIESLRFSLLTPEERSVFENPLADKFEQMDREHDVSKGIIANKANQPVKQMLFSYLGSHRYNSSMSTSLVEVAQIAVEAYKSARKLDTSKTQKNQHTPNTLG